MQNEFDNQEGFLNNETEFLPPAEAKSTQKTKRTSTKKTTSKKKDHIGVVYNAPVTLTFALICIVAIFLKDRLQNLPVIFTAPGCQTSEFAFNWKDPVHYIRLFLHVFGHTDWNQLTGNLAFILLLNVGIHIDRDRSGKANPAAQHAYINKNARKNTKLRSIYTSDVIETFIFSLFKLHGYTLIRVSFFFKGDKSGNERRTSLPAL